MLTIAQEASSQFALVDWLIVAIYLVIVMTIGIAAGAKRRGTGEFFLAGRSMPMWAVALSVLATSQSAATFVGGPQEAYAGDLTYLSANLGALVGVVVVAVFFIPAFYRHGVTSVYELIGHAYGSRAQQLASAMFMIGRVFASGARLFIVAIPFALIAFGDLSTWQLIAAVWIITAAATVYTSIGGIRAVIWTDALQAGIYIATIAGALVFIWMKLPVTPVEAIEFLQSDEASKTTFLDASIDVEMFTKPYNLWAILFGLTLFNIAAFGADQDLTQRMLTCRSARAGGWSVVLSNLIGWPVIALFMLMGLLLFVYYQRGPGVSAELGYELDDSRAVFLNFILHEIPTGLRGLMMAGLFAAAMSSLDSALNAMSSTTVADFVRPRMQRKGWDEARASRIERRIARLAIVGWACMLAGFATCCVFLQERSGQTLITFALGVMVFAYAGLLAVFATAIFTKRGSAVSVAVALGVGFLVVLGIRLPGMVNSDWAVPLAFPWQMLLATTIAFGVCCLGRRHLNDGAQQETRPS